MFQSWVTRCGSGNCKAPDRGCQPSDPGFCGQQSMPLNLPETGQPDYSLTRLTIDGLKILGWPPP